MSAGIVTDGGLADLALGYYVLVVFAPHPLGLQFGTGSGQAGTADALAAPVQDVVEATSYSHEVTTNVTNDTFRVTGTLTATEDNTITEVGVFALNEGDPYLVFYGDFDGINLATGDAIVFQVNVVFS